MIYYQIDNEHIPVGNYAFIYDVTKNEDLFYKFYDAEKNLKVDYIDFAHKIRVAFEAFALEEETKRRCEMEGAVESFEFIKESIIREIREPASVINYKTIIINLCNGRELEYKNLLEKYLFVRKNASDDEIIRKFKAFIRYIYAFGSESSHENVSSEDKYIANKENCIRIAASFHDFLATYYGVESKFDSTLVPIRDYCAVPKRVVERMGLNLDIGKQLFVKEMKGRVGYYIFSNDIESITQGQRRDIDTISKLWDENIDDPSNVIRQTESIGGNNRDYKFQVYALPGKPIRLTKDFIESLTIEEKLCIVSGLCKGVYSLHTYVTPMYHRNINPDAFYIFNVKGKYKPLLAKFDCTKDSDNAEFTVYQNIEKKVLNSNTNSFFAPEVINSNLGVGVDWRKADIYSLAKTITMIIWGKSDISMLDEIDGVDDEVVLTLIEMMDDCPNNRPEVLDLINLL